MIVSRRVRVSNMITLTLLLKRERKILRIIWMSSRPRRRRLSLSTEKVVDNMIFSNRISRS
jgi:hypothetical protein